MGKSVNNRVRKVRFEDRVRPDVTQWRDIEKGHMHNKPLFTRGVQQTERYVPKISNQQTEVSFEDVEQLARMQ